MGDAALEHLARDLENERVERKASLANTSNVAEAVCALANDLAGSSTPGVVLIGVSNTGDAAGLEVTDRLLLEIADLRGNGQLQPFPILSVEPRTLQGTDIVVVRVEPSDSTPIRYNGRVFVRVGPSTRIASLEEERRLAEKRRAGDLPFDARPLGSANLADLDLDLFRADYLPGAVAPEVLEENGRTAIEQLASLRFATPEGTPTAAGLIVLGTEPTAFVPGSYLQFLRVDGPTLDAPIKDEKRVDGPLPQQLRTLDEVLRANVATAVDLTSGDIETAVPDYPLAALQQLVRNAVMHRTYEGTAAPVRITWLSDRIEIVSPGGPFGQVTVENFGTPGITDYRNPTVAEAMKALGYVQRFGVGIATARRLLVSNGNPPLELEARPENVLARVWGR